jgi:hypothetical protein
MTMSDPVTSAARAAAELLAEDYGPELAAEVEAILHARRSPRSDQYFDPVSVGALIVAIAALAWNVYADLRKRRPQPSPDVVARQVRAELREHHSPGPDKADQIVDVVVTEVIRAARDSP